MVINKYICFSILCLLSSYENLRQVMIMTSLPPLNNDSNLFLYSAASFIQSSLKIFDCSNHSTLKYFAELYGVPKQSNSKNT